MGGKARRIPRIALGPREARQAAWAHLAPPLGTLVVRLAVRDRSPALRTVLRQAYRLGGGLVAVLLGLSLLAYATEGGSQVLLGVLGFLFLLTFTGWVALSAWLAAAALSGRVPLLAGRP